MKIVLNMELRYRKSSDRGYLSLLSSFFFYSSFSLEDSFSEELISSMRLGESTVSGTVADAAGAAL